MQKEVSPSNKNKTVSRSSSADVFSDFTSSVIQENSNDSDNQQDHFVNEFVFPINYAKYIISPEEASQSNNLSSSDIDLNADDSDKKANKLKKKLKLIPISKAKDQVMQLMKLSNDEYIAQVDNMKRSEKSLEVIGNKIKDMGPVKFDILHHPIIFEIAKNNYTIEYCKQEIERIKLNIDSYAILYNEIEKELQTETSTPQPQANIKTNSSSQSPDSILVNENASHRSSVDDTNPKTRSRFGYNLLRRRTNPTKRASLLQEFSPIVQSPDQSSTEQQIESNTNQKNSNQERTPQDQQATQIQKKQKFQKRQQTPPQQQMKSQQTIPEEPSNEKLVNISEFSKQCLKLRNKPHYFIQRRSMLHRLSLPFPIDKTIEFVDPNKPIEQTEDKDSQNPPTNNTNTPTQNFIATSKEPKSALYIKLSEEAKNSFIIDPNVDKVGYLLDTNSKSGRIIQRFKLKSDEMQYDDIEVIADALYNLSSDYLTRDEIIGILFDIMWTSNPRKYPICPRVNTFWVPYIMDLIPAAVNPPYLSEKWKRMTFLELSNIKDWPLREAVDSLFDLYLHSNPFEIGRCFSNTINLVAVAVQKMVKSEGGKPEDIEIDFDQLFNLLIVCIFSSGLPTITEPLSYASYFDQYACGNNEIHFAMSHMEGLCAHLPKINFKELREKSNKLKEQYRKEEEERGKK